MLQELDRLVETLSQRYFGKYRGEVTGTADPTRRGRLKVTCPAVLGDQEVWAMPCAPYAGQDIGLFALPPSGTSVWVEFEGGDINQPIWAGCFWKDGEISSADATEQVAFFKTPGLTLHIDNNSGEVKIESSSGAKITLSTSGIKIEGTQIELSGGGSLKVSSSGVDAMNGAFTVM